MNLHDEISVIKGVGSKLKESLNNCGIFTVLDLLLYFPRDYEFIKMEDGTQLAESKNKLLLECTVAGIERDIRTKTKKTITTVIFRVNNLTLKGKWFNQPYMKDKFRINESYLISGRVQQFNNEMSIVNPVIVNNAAAKLSNDSLAVKGSHREAVVAETKIMPKYPLRPGITNNFLVKIIWQVLREVKIVENLPLWVVEKYKFYSLDKAIRIVHCPKNLEELNMAKTRLKFQELFVYSLKILLLKNFLNKDNRGIAFSISPELKELKEKLPFKLTNAQSKVVREILLDQKKNRQMNRMVQGDVGSGKTIVAIISMFNVVKNGYQAALIAPTEILASQHVLEIQKLLKDFNLNISLLSGSRAAKQKENIKKELSEGKIDIIVGTHALLEEDVVFKNLGMVVTDEQHRFGVLQRSSLYNKGKNVDILVMTATPIPRTLALFLYGDLEVSSINELPPGRQHIDTSYFEKSKKAAAYKLALNEIQKGRQAYIVCPLVEENENLDLDSVEQLHEELSKSYFKDINVEILHGKMPSKTKEDIMNRFKAGEIKVLISTTVIEVGINVPNATVMIIENAERFGLSQLHQLRGRVGRGSHKSYCILIANIKNEIIEKRLQIIANNHSGFIIAEEDMKIRGSGELFGIRQHGDNNFVFADLIEDINIFRTANELAKYVIKSNSLEDQRIKEEVTRNLNNNSKLICFN